MKKKNQTMKKKEMPGTATARLLDQSSPQNESLIKVGILGLFLAAGFLLFYPILDNPTHFDDVYHVNIPAVQKIAPVIHFFQYNLDSGVDVPHRGVALLTHALTRAISAEYDYFWYYFTNITLHSLNAFLFFLLSVTLFQLVGIGEKEEKVFSVLLPAFVCGLIFLVHPIQLNVVAYLAQRTSLLMFSFMCLSLIFFLRFKLSGKKLGSWYFLSLIMFPLALLSKENSVTLLGILFLVSIYFWKEGREGGSFPRHLAYLLPYLFVIMAYAPLIHFQTHTEIFASTPLEYFAVQCVVIPQYLLTLLLPLPQWMSVDWFTPTYGSLLVFPVLPGLLFLVALLAGSIVCLRFPKLYLPSFGILWFFLTISPDSSFIPLPETKVEYRLYTPFAGFIVTFVSLLWLSLGKFLPSRVKVFSLISGTVILLYVGATELRIPVFDSDMAFWNDAVEKSPDSARAYINRGISLQKEGNHEAALQDFNKALELNNLKRDKGIIHVSRGNVYAAMGKHEEAIADYTKAIEIKQDDADAYFFRSKVHRSLNNWEMTYRDIDQAIAFKKNQPLYYFERALLNQEQNRLEEALEDYSSAINHGGGKTAILYLNRGSAYQELGKYQEAISDYNKVIELKAKNVDAYFNRGVSYLALRKLPDALESFQKGCELGDEGSCTNARLLTQGR